VFVATLGWSRAAYRAFVTDVRLDDRLTLLVKQDVSIGLTGTPVSVQRHAAPCVALAGDDPAPASVGDDLDPWWSKLAYRPGRQVMKRVTLSIKRPIAAPTRSGDFLPVVAGQTCGRLGK
jgi:hypothetical protein